MFANGSRKADKTRMLDTKEKEKFANVPGVNLKIVKWILMERVNVRSTFTLTLGCKKEYKRDAE